MRRLLFPVLLGLSAPALAADVPEAIARQLQQTFPEVRAEQISPTPVPGCSSCASARRLPMSPPTAATWCAGTSST
ncbi:MAG: hypothetical protein M5R42_09995 [Rhodocyclaceae bacterium]|nr:hypothetical protein [Rhodocyclaceae bacterium]